MICCHAPNIANRDVFFSSLGTALISVYIAPQIIYFGSSARVQSGGVAITVAPPGLFVQCLDVEPS